MITYRLEKGAPLSILEIDNNFRELEQRLKAFEEHPPAPAITIEQREDQLLFKANGEVFGAVVMPKFQPIYNGAWAAYTAYRIGCWIHLQRKLFACKVPHTSGAAFEPSFWTLVFDGGADA